MGKKNQPKRGGNRFFRWIKSDLPDNEEKKSPVLLLGVSKITESPFVRRRSVEASRPTGSIKFYRPPKSKYTRGLEGDERLEKIRQDLLTHKHGSDVYIPKESPQEKVNVHKETCIKLNCVNSCVCKGRKSSSNRGSFSLRPENRQSSLCPSEPYGVPECTDEREDIEYKYTEHVPDIQPCSSKQNSYNVTSKSADRRSFLLSNLNERFRKTLSLDSRKIETNIAPLSLPQEARPKSLVNDNITVQHYEENPLLKENFNKVCQPKKKRKSFFSIETFFDKKSDSSSTDDFCSSKYKRFELESDDSPLFRRDQTIKERTPDLLNLPVIIDSVRKKQTDAKRQLEKLESHYFNSLNNETVRTVIDAVPKDDIKGNTGHSNNQYLDDSDVEYVEPIKSNFTSQSTLILDKNIPNDLLKPASILTINTEETDIRLPSSTVSPKSNEVSRTDNDLDSIGPYEIEVKESDLLHDRVKNLTVKIMDKSMDSIGSCSLDVDASTDFSDTTSGSLNLLTPSSTTSRIKEFTSRIQERASFSPNLTPRPDATPTPATLTPTPNDHLLKPPPKVVVHDTSSHRSRQKKQEYKKPSYLNLACSVNGYTNLTTYDSKLRQDLNRSREASPIRPITHYQYKTESNSLLVPVPISANKLVVSKFEPHDIKSDLTKRAPTKALTDPYLATSPINAFMAEENKLLKKEFLGTNMTTTSRPYISSESKNFASSMLHDEVDNTKFKSSYSETNFRKTVSSNGQKIESHFSSESYTVHNTNGVSKCVEMTKENGEIVTSPMKSFIQQRVERLYGPGALAQGFFNQKRHKQSSQSDIEDYRVLQEKSLNLSENRRKSNDKEYTSPSRDDTLPVLRHLRPEFRAQLVITSPKKGVRSEPSPVKEDIPKTNEESVSEVTNGVSVIKVDSATVNGGPSASVNEGPSESVNGGPSASLNGGPSDANGCAEVVKDGHYFLELEKRETERLIALAVTAEKELEVLQQDPSISEEVLGFLRSASGKARLLATQKMRQFEGLCYNNINEPSGSQFPTTAEDLQGFWDMVCLQVTSVDAMYDNIRRLKENGWKEICVSPPPAAPRPRPARVSQTNSEKNKATVDKRQQERKAMLEERRRLARERAAASSRTDDNGEQEVVIFVGKGKSSGDACNTESMNGGPSHTS